MKEGELFLEEHYDQSTFTDVSVIESKGVRNIVLSTDSGRLFVYPMPDFVMPEPSPLDSDILEKDENGERRLEFLLPGHEAEVSNFHFGSITQLSWANNVLVSAGKDGSVMVYKVKTTNNRNYG